MKIKADATGLGVDITDSDKEFASKISKHNLFGMLGDQIASWRFRNAVRIFRKTEQLAKENGVSINFVPSKFLQQFVEASSLEEDDSLQSMWANLLVNKSKSSNSVNILYINILKSLEPIEAELLQLLYRQSGASTSTVFSFEVVLQSSSTTDIGLKVIIHKLYGFNVLRPPLMQGIAIGSPSGSHSPAVETTDAFRFSELGLDFCQKCGAGVER